MTRGVATALALCVLAAGCGGEPVRYYRGAVSGSETQGAATDTISSTGSIVSIAPGETQGTYAVFLDNLAELQATLMGTVLTFVPGQSLSSHVNGQANNVSLTTATGTMTGDHLSFTISYGGTSTHVGTTSNVSATYTFDGDRL
jgi:hypothetical protein